MVDNCVINKGNSDKDDPKIDSKRSMNTEVATNQEIQQQKIVKTASMGDVVNETLSNNKKLIIMETTNNGHIMEQRTSSSEDHEDVILIDDSSSDSSAANNTNNVNNRSIGASVLPVVAPTTPAPPAPLLPPPPPALTKVVITNDSNKPGKSILENFLTRPLNPPPPPLQMSQLMQQPVATNNSENTTIQVVDNRKVEPLKINLHREPIKTVIKIPQQEQQHSPKITIKPLKPPEPQPHVADEKPTPEENLGIIPKLHIRNINESPSVEIQQQNSSSSSSTTEAHIIPKLTIRNLHHSTSSTTIATAAVNNSIDNNGSSIGSSSSNSSSCSSETGAFHAIVPKLTIKIDNHGTHHSNVSPGSEASHSHSKREKKNAALNDEGAITSEGNISFTI